jgi:tetratricopeptide (TPR) repeat protein
MRSSRELWTNRLARIAVFLLLVFSGGPRSALVQSASAQTKQDGCLKDTVCKDHYDKALKFYDQGQYADALPEFQAAYERRQMPWLMLNVGRTMQRLGRPQEAINYYERYKKAELNMEPATLARVNKYIEQAQALVDKGPEPTSKAPDTGAGTGAGPAPNSGPSSGVAATLTLNPGQETPPPPKPIYKKWWFWTIIGAVVVGGVVGGVAGGLAHKSSSAPNLIPSGDPVYMPTF